MSTLEDRLARLESLLGIDSKSGLKRGVWGIGQLAAGHLEFGQFESITSGGCFSCRPFPGGTNSRRYANFWPLSNGEVARLIADGCPLEREL
jgi:hypothetical protein